MNEYTTSWTGKYPNLCSGHWELFCNGEQLNIYIPFYQNPADTFGEYSRWYFDEDWMDCWDTYEEGEKQDEWIAHFHDWLDSFAPAEDWPAIYEAFQLNDWRHMSCGGCI